MSQSAYIKLVPASTVQQMTLDGIKDCLQQYQEQAALTGSQLGWDYREAAFPYTLETKQDDRWFYLKGINSHYNYIIFGIHEAPSASGELVPCIQVVLPEGATHGDKAKGNELCKYIAKKLQAELTMFNGRTLYCYPRK